MDSVLSTLITSSSSVECEAHDTLYVPRLGNTKFVLHVFADGGHESFDKFLVQLARILKTSDHVHHGTRVGRPGEVEHLSRAQLTHDHLQIEKTKRIIHNIDFGVASRKFRKISDFQTPYITCLHCIELESKNVSKYKNINIIILSP